MPQQYAQRMKYSLSITVGCGSAKSVSFEADLGRDSAHGCPDSFEGQLLDVPLNQILEFKFEAGVEVGFRGCRYRFKELEKEGSFTLCRGK